MKKILVLIGCLLISVSLFARSKSYQCDLMKRINPIGKPGTVEMSLRLGRDKTSADVVIKKWKKGSKRFVTTLSMTRSAKRVFSFGKASDKEIYVSLSTATYELDTVVYNVHSEFYIMDGSNSQVGIDILKSKNPLLSDSYILNCIML